MVPGRLRMLPVPATVPSLRYRFLPSVYNTELPTGTINEAKTPVPTLRVPGAVPSLTQTPEGVAKKRRSPATEADMAVPVFSSDCVPPTLPSDFHRAPDVDHVYAFPPIAMIGAESSP